MLPHGYAEINGKLSPVPQIYTLETTILAENNSFQLPQFSRKIYIVCKIGPKMSLSKNFSKPTSKTGDMGHFDLWSHFCPTLKINCSVPLNSYKKVLQQLCFVLIVFVTPETMSCIHIKQ